MKFHGLWDGGMIEDVLQLELGQHFQPDLKGTVQPCTNIAAPDSPSDQGALALSAPATYGPADPFDRSGAFTCRRQAPSGAIPAADGPIIEPSPQLQLSTIIPTSKSSCCCLPGASSTASNGSAHLPPHFPRHSIPHSALAATSPPYLPRVRSLAAFGRRPPVDVARLSMAGIRNPAHKRSWRHLQNAAH
jgi:hypothetical protein